MTLTRRQLNSLYIAVWASTQGDLMGSKKFRDNPDLAALDAKHQAEAAVRAHNTNGKRNGRNNAGRQS